MNIDLDQLSATIRASLNDALVNVTGADRIEYETWLSTMTPLIAGYATVAAQGDAEAALLLNQIKAQAEAKAWAIAIDAQSQSAVAASSIALAVASTALKFLLLVA